VKLISDNKIYVLLWMMFVEGRTVESQTILVMYRAHKVTFLVLVS